MRNPIITATILACVIASPAGAQTDRKPTGKLQSAVSTISNGLVNNLAAQAGSIGMAIPKGTINLPGTSLYREYPFTINTRGPAGVPRAATGAGSTIEISVSGA